MAKGFMTSLDALKTDAMKRGALDARQGVEMDPMKNRHIVRRLEGLSGSRRKNAEQVMRAGYAEGYAKAEQWLSTLNA